MNCFFVRALLPYYDVQLRCENYALSFLPDFGTRSFLLLPLQHISPPFYGCALFLPPTLFSFFLLLSFFSQRNHMHGECTPSRPRTSAMQPPKATCRPHSHNGACIGGSPCGDRSQLRHCLTHHGTEKISRSNKKRPRIRTSTRDDQVQLSWLAPTVTGREREKEKRGLHRADACSAFGVSLTPSLSNARRRPVCFYCLVWHR